MNKILDIAYEKDASDIHLICNNKPILRIARTLVPIEEMDVLTPDDMNEMYDYLVMGNVEKDEVFNTTRKLDTSYEYKGVRLRVNISLSDAYVNRNVIIRVSSVCHSVFPKLSVKRASAGIQLFILQECFLLSVRFT